MSEYGSMQREITTIVLHHSQTPPGTPNADVLAMIDAAHRRMCHPIANAYGYHIAHHYLIYEDGTYHKTRPLSEVGAHTYDARVDQSSVSLCFIGDFTTASPSDRQYDTAIMLVRELRSRYPTARVVGHSTIVPIDCPGGGVDVAAISSAGFPTYDEQVDQHNRDDSASTKHVSPSDTASSSHDEKNNNPSDHSHDQAVSTPAWVSMLKHRHHHQRASVYDSGIDGVVDGERWQHVGLLVWDCVLAALVAVAGFVIVAAYLYALGQRFGDGSGSWHLPRRIGLVMLVLSQVIVRRRRRHVGDVRDDEV